MIAQRNKTTWANTDATLGPNVLFKEKPTHQIAIGELGWGGGALKTFLEYAEVESHADDAATEKIQELKGLLIRQSIDR